MLTSVDLEKHLQKTFIDRIERGFDFLGYHSARRVSAFPGQRFLISSGVCAGFTSKSREGLSPPPGSGRTFNAGSGGPERGSAWTPCS